MLRKTDFLLGMELKYSYHLMVSYSIKSKILDSGK